MAEDTRYIAVAAFDTKEARDRWVSHMKRAIQEGDSGIDYLLYSSKIRTGHVTFYPWYSIKRLLLAVFSVTEIYSKRGD